MGTTQLTLVNVSKSSARFLAGWGLCLFTEASLDYCAKLSSDTREPREQFVPDFGMANDVFRRRFHAVRVDACGDILSLLDHVLGLNPSLPNGCATARTGVFDKPERRLSPPAHWT